MFYLFQHFLSCEEKQGTNFDQSFKVWTQEASIYPLSPRTSFKKFEESERAFSEKFFLENKDEKVECFNRDLY